MKETNSSICDIRNYSEMLTGIKVVLKFALILNNQPPDLKNSINSVWSKRNGHLNLLSDQDVHAMFTCKFC